MSNPLKPTRPLVDKSLKGYYAGFVSRLLAFVIDVVMVTLIVLIFNSAVAIVLGFFNIDVAALVQSDNSFTTIAALIFVFGNMLVVMSVWVFYFIVAWTLVGQTIGKRILGLRVVSVDGNLITFKQAVFRYAGYWLSAMPLFLGFLWVLVDDERRSWHDKIARTCVIYSWDARRGPWLQQKILEAQAIEVGHKKAEARQIARRKTDQAADGSTGSRTKKRLPG